MGLADLSADEHLARIVVTLAMLAMYSKEYVSFGLSLDIFGPTVLVYIALIWAPKRWWTAAKYIWISTLILTGAMLLHLVIGVSNASILWPLVYLLAVAPAKYGRISAILALFATAVVLVLIYASTFPFGYLIDIAGFFAGIRSRRVRQDAYRLSKLHLEELNQAHRKLQETHADLQEATVHSMRYAAIEERSRLSREIHDGLGHELTSLIVQLQKLEILVTDNEPALRTVSQLLHISRKAMAETRTAVREWADNDNGMGLGIVALRGLVSQTQGRSELRFSFQEESEISEWPIETSVTVYRVFQESLTNVLRHADASSVAVSIKEENETIVLKIIDDGQFTGENPLTQGFGLKGIEERCRLIGGRCTLSSNKPHGLQIEVAVPIEPRDSQMWQISGTAKAESGNS